MSAPPYMKLYWGDYHRDTRHLNRGEHGAYLLLLSALWNEGGRIPADDDTLARYALCTAEEWEQIKPRILAFFIVRRGKLTHKRVTEELASYEATLCRRKQAGKLGGIVSAEKRKINRQANATRLPSNRQANADITRTIYSSVASPNGEPTGAEGAVDFDREAWDRAVRTMTERGGVTEKAARSLFGRLLSKNGLSARDLLPAITTADVNGTQDPVGYLTKAAEAIARRRIGDAPKRVGFV